MSCFSRAATCLFVGVLLLNVSAAQAQDWPQWRGPNRDGKATGFKAPATWPKELTKKWDVPVGNAVANPSLVGDRLYVFTREVDEEIVRCLDATSNKELWKDHYASDPPSSYGAGGGRFVGPRATPTVADGRVVTLGANGILSCYDASTGELKWRKSDFVGQVPGFYSASSPLVVNGMCIVQLGAGLGEGSRPGDVLGAMYAFDMATGDQKWKAPDVSPTYGSPILMTVDGMKVVFAVSESKVSGVNLANGKVVWTMKYKQGRYNAASPIVDGQTLIISGPEGRGLTAMKMTKQGEEVKEEETWTYSENLVLFNTPVLKDGALYGLSTRDQLFAVNSQHATGWTAPIVPAPQALIIPSGSQAVFAQTQQPEGERGRGEGAAGQGERRGESRGQQRGARGPRGGGGGERPGYGSVVDAGSVLIALCPRGDLVVFKPSAEEYTELARYRVSEDGDVYSHPVLSGNRIYIKDKDSLSMWIVE